ncbi:MotA/TolQ/ExbB proton channel family protein [soil metagenome]
MLETKRTTHILAALGALALMTAGAPALAQTAAAPATATDTATTRTTNTTPAAAPASASPEADSPAKSGKITPVTMFIDATPVVKTVMIGLLLASIFTWTTLIIKIFEFNALNRSSNKYLEAFRGARSIADINRISTAEEFEGNPMADMAAAASGEVELSRQAGLAVSGDHRDSTLSRASQAVNAVQAGLGKRLSGGMQLLASVGSSGPFIGLFGTVYGIMNSFIGIANTNTTNLAVVAPGIAEALLATGIGLFAAIPSVIFYNYFQTRISAYGTRTEGFVAELMNAISRQLDKGA